MKEAELISSIRMTHHIHDRVFSADARLSFPTPRIGFVEKGSAEILCRGKTFRAEESDLIYIASGTQYYSLWKGDPEVRFYSVTFSFAGNCVRPEYRFQIVPGWNVSRFEEMYRMYSDENLFGLAARFYRLLEELYPRMTAERPEAEASAVRPAIRYIEEHCRENIAVEALAALCQCSSSHFYCRFREATGVSPIVYKQSVLVQHALDLLLHSERSVEDISNELGFSSPNYFRRVFTRFIRQTPGAFRRSHRGDLL